MINSNDRFVRWQTVLRQHFTNLNNLLLTISIGMVGFLVALLCDSDFKPVYCEKLFFTTGLILTFIAALIGIATSLSRLIDFRATVKKIKSDHNGSAITESLELKEIMEIYGKLSWRLLYAQIGFLCFGIFFLLIAFLLIHIEKLF